jgi:lysophospholipase L1-like esterase
MSTEYLRQAVSGESFDPGPLPLESDGIHPTDAGHRKWAELIAEHLFR